MLLHARTSRCNLRPTSETPAGRGGCQAASAPRYSGEPDDTNRASPQPPFRSRPRFGQADVRSGRTPQGVPPGAKTAQDGPAVAIRRESTGMQVRSWMAAVVLVAGSTLLLSGVARSQKSGSDQTPPSAEGQDAGAPNSGQPKPERPGKKIHPEYPDCRA